MLYRGFPSKLHHEVPHWVEPGALFHIRIAIDRDVLMPDHLHALLSFARDQSISKVVGDWKHFQARQHGIIWQEGYFDHRLRDDERGEQLSAKMNYIRQNPVAAGLCARAQDWPWIIERAGGSSSPLSASRTDLSGGELDAKN